VKAWVTWLALTVGMSIAIGAMFALSCCTPAAAVRAETAVQDLGPLACAIVHQSNDSKVIADACGLAVETAEAILKGKAAALPPETTITPVPGGKP
jgi:CBS-domain-containing membrane protein